MMMSLRLVLLLTSSALIAAPAFAERNDLPPPEAVAQALDNAPAVRASVARIDSAKASENALRAGPYEVTVSASAIRRSVTRERDYAEFDATVSRPFRLPGKARLDRSAGALGVEVASNNAEDARHQAALMLSGLWHDWLLASALYRNDQLNITYNQQALAAVKRRMALRDAAALDVDQTQSVLSQAQAQAAQSLSAVKRARLALATEFPQIPLGNAAPDLAPPEMPEEPLQTLRNLVLGRSHEIRAADREAQRLAVVARRAKLDRVADPSFGVRLFSERDGLERGAGIVASMPFGGSHRRALADRASSEASAALIDVERIRRSITVIADTDMSDGAALFDAWCASRDAATSAAAAAARTARGYAVGVIDLSDVLYAQRQANDARRTEIAARAEAARALFRLRIDSHTIWTPGGEAE